MSPAKKVAEVAEEVKAGAGDMEEQSSSKISPADHLLDN